MHVLQRVVNKQYLSAFFVHFILAGILFSIAVKVYANEILDKKHFPSGIFYQAEQDTSKLLPTKSPKGAMLRSLVVPGWGQWYNEKKFKAVLVFATEVGIATNSIIQNQYVQQSTSDLERDYYIDNRNLSNWVLVAAILVSMLDAYVDAHMYHFDESTELGYAKPKCNRTIVPSEIVWFTSLTINF